MDDYLAGRAPAAAFYAGSPARLAPYRRKLEEVSRRFDRNARARAAAALRPTSPSAARRLARFVEEGGAMVTTGQQAGLFTGPLYTVHKALTALRLAGALEAALGTVVLPVFWCASEDHDFAEAGETYVVDRAGRLRRLAVAPTDPRPLPMSEMRLGSDVESTLDELCQNVADKIDRADHFRHILEAYTPGETVGGAFRATLERLFAGFDLLVADAADPALKAATLPALLAEAEDAPGRARALAARGAALERAGYSPQVALLPDASNLFFHGAAGRERLQLDGGGFAAPGAGLRFTAAELAARIRDEPGRFSPNVLLRPVAESTAFPTLAYVGGPGELAYWPQAGPLFAASEILPPVAFPRFSARIVPPAVAEAARETGLGEAELRLPEHEAAALLAGRRLPEALRARMAALRVALVEGFGAVIEEARGIDPNLEGAVGARRNRAILEAAAAERKVLAHLKRRDPVVSRALPLARNHLAPRGGPQERTLSVFTYLGADPALLAELAARMEIRLDGGAGEGGGPRPAPERPAASDAADAPPAATR